MFRSLADKLAGDFDKLKGRGLLTEDIVNDSMREIRIALLEADVALPVVVEENFVLEFFPFLVLQGCVISVI